MSTDEEIKRKMDKLVSQSTILIASPETIEKLKSKGHPIKSTTITYKDYLDALFDKRRKIADSLIKTLPHLSDSVANGTISALYEELKECFAFGIPGAGITLALILFELACKYRLFEEWKKNDPNIKWERIEEIKLSSVIKGLRKHKVISEEERKKLDEFNADTRNSYIHYNIQKLVKDMVIGELPSMNIETGEITVVKDVNAAEYPHLWFSAKRVLDQKTVVLIVSFCISWVNRLLSTSK